MADHIISKLDEFPPGARKIVQLEGRSVGVFNIDGKFYALRNSCPHQGAPLCLGPVRGMMTSEKPQEYNYERDGEILVCPWHRWEFDIQTGKSIFNPHKLRVKTYPVTVEKEQDPSIETYKVSLKKGLVILHL
ncbi:MAG: Rieske (2Fe-2S) protein [bacterium]